MHIHYMPSFLDFCPIQLFTTEHRDHSLNVLKMQVSLVAQMIEESACIAGSPGLVAGSGRSGEGNGNPLQYSCLGNPMDGGTWRAYSPWGGKESDMT